MSHRFRRLILGFAAVIAAGVLLSCASRYRLNLSVTDQGETRRVNVDQTQFAPNAVLGDPASEDQIRPGSGNCIVVLGSANSRMQNPSGRYDVLRYDEILRYRVFLQLPSTLAVGNWPLADRSFVEIMGRYELRKEEKLFTQSSGSMVIDSLSKSRAFMSIDGEFKNASGAALTVKGQFRVKIK